MENEQDLSSLQGHAHGLSIPQESLQHPEIQNYIRLVDMAASLQRELTVSAGNTAGLDLAVERDLLDAPDMVLPLRTRYQISELLLRAAYTVLIQDITPPYAERGYLVSKLNAGLGQLGLKIVTDKPSESK